MIWRRGRRHSSARSFNALQAALAEKGIPLLFHEVADFNASIETVKNVCRQHDVSHLFYNYQYEFNERQRDAAVEKRCPLSSAKALTIA